MVKSVNNFGWYPVITVVEEVVVAIVDDIVASFCTWQHLVHLLYRIPPQVCSLPLFSGVVACVWLFNCSDSH